MNMQNSIFPLGEKNDRYAQYFTGQSYLAFLSSRQLAIANVTFEPSCRNNWHIHCAKSGGGQILICITGEGWYQEKGRPPVKLKPGMTINIPANVRHWHGATKDSWFSHIAISVPGEETSTQWLYAVSDEEYNEL